MKSTSITFMLSAALVLSAGLMLAAMLGGCSGPPPTVPPAPPPQVGPSDQDHLALGAPAADGASPMVPFSDGQDVQLVAGAQGGFHVWMQYALEGVPAGAMVKVERLAHRVSDNAVVLRFDSVEAVGALGGDGWYRTGSFPMFMCPTPIGISVVDTPIVFELHVSDENGAAELARAAITLVPRCPDARRDLCTRICTG